MSTLLTLHPHDLRASNESVCIVCIVCIVLAPALLLCSSMYFCLGTCSQQNAPLHGLCFDGLTHAAFLSSSPQLHTPEATRLSPRFKNLKPAMPSPPIASTSKSSMSSVSSTSTKVASTQPTPSGSGPQSRPMSTVDSDEESVDEDVDYMPQK